MESSLMTYTRKNALENDAKPKDNTKTRMGKEGRGGNNAGARVFANFYLAESFALVSE